jgi:hypothetical protein
MPRRGRSPGRKVGGRESWVIEAITKAGGELGSARCLSEIVPLKWPMGTGKVLKYAVVVAGMKRWSAARGDADVA